MSFVNQLKDCETVTVPDTNPVLQTAFPWADSAEWAVMKSAFIRDQEYIRNAARDAGISPRILLGELLVSNSDSLPTVEILSKVILNH